MQVNSLNAFSSFKMPNGVIKPIQNAQQATPTSNAVKVNNSSAEVKEPNSVLDNSSLKSNPKKIALGAAVAFGALAAGMILLKRGKGADEVLSEVHIIQKEADEAYKATCEMFESAKKKVNELAKCIKRSAADDFNEVRENGLIRTFEMRGMDYDDIPYLMRETNEAGNLVREVSISGFIPDNIIEYSPDGNVARIIRTDLEGAVSYVAEGIRKDGDVSVGQKLAQRMRDGNLELIQDVKVQPDGNFNIADTFLFEGSKLVQYSRNLRSTPEGSCVQELLYKLNESGELVKV